MLEGKYECYEETSKALLKDVLCPDIHKHSHFRERALFCSKILFNTITL